MYYQVERGKYILFGFISLIANQTIVGYLMPKLNMFVKIKFEFDYYYLSNIDNFFTLL